jgi:hypothetical protein
VQKLFAWISVFRCPCELLSSVGPTLAIIGGKNIQGFVEIDGQGFSKQMPCELLANVGPAKL